MLILKLIMDLNPQQKKAATTLDRPFALSAGAGTGKTRVLVERYIEIILHGGVKPENILAITFTNKAASEMKKRVRVGLHNALKDVTDSNRKNSLEGALAQLEAAPISTIHSFCQSLLREYSVESELDPEFRGIDGNEASLLKDNAVQKAVSKLLRSNDDGFRELLFRLKLNGIA